MNEGEVSTSKPTDKQYHFRVIAHTDRNEVVSMLATFSSKHPPIDQITEIEDEITRRYGVKRAVITNVYRISVD